MKAPDKIYIHTRTEPYCSITWSEVKEENCTNEEYIRKEALLDWADKKASECLNVTGELDIAIGRHAAYLDMIDKIKSL